MLSNARFTTIDSHTPVQNNERWQKVSTAQIVEKLLQECLQFRTHTFLFGNISIQVYPISLDCVVLLRNAYP